MGLTKQAKILTPKQLKTVLTHIENTRYPQRSKLMVLLSVKAGLRAKEISSIEWSMVCDPEFNITDLISLENKSSKGKKGGRAIPMNKDLRKALIEYKEHISPSHPNTPIFISERGEVMSPKVIANWFKRLYSDDMGFEGCSSHSGRRAFITRAAQHISLCGGSLRDVQMLAGHQDLSTTQRYIETDSLAMKKVVDLI